MPSATHRLNIATSPLLAGLILVAHGGALACLAASTLAPSAAGLVALGVLVSAWGQLRAEALRNTLRAIVSVSLDETGRGRVWLGNQDCHEDLQLTGGANTALVLCLDLRDMYGHRYRVNIARDAMDEESLRALRMRFEHALVHGKSTRT